MTGDISSSYSDDSSCRLGDLGNRWMFLTDASTKEEKDKAPLLKKLTLAADQDFSSNERKYEFEVFLTHGDTPYILTGTITLDTESLQNLKSMHSNINSYEKAAVAALVAFNDLQKDESFIQDIVDCLGDFQKNKKLTYGVKASEFTITLDLTKSGCTARSDQLFDGKEVTIPFDRFSKIPELVALHLRDIGKITSTAENLYQRTDDLCNKLGTLSDYISSLIKKEKKLKRKKARLETEINELKHKKSLASGEEKENIEAQITKKEEEVTELEKEIKVYQKKIFIPLLDLPLDAEWHQKIAHVFKGVTHSGTSWSMNPPPGEIKRARNLSREINDHLSQISQIRDEIVASYKKIKDLEEKQKSPDTTETAQFDEQIEQENAKILNHRKRIVKIEKLRIEQFLPAANQLPDTIPKPKIHPLVPLDTVIDPSSPYPLRGRVQKQT